MGREEVGSLENQGSQFPRHPTSLKNKTKFDNDKELQIGERSSRSSHIYDQLIMETDNPIFTWQCGLRLCCGFKTRPVLVLVGGLSG